MTKTSKATKLTSLVLSIMMIMSLFTVTAGAATTARTYIPLDVTGFNYDVILDMGETSVTNYDNTYAFASDSYVKSKDKTKSGLPDDGKISIPKNQENVLFQLAPYNDNNTARFNKSAITLTLTTPGSYSSLALLGSYAGKSSATIQATLIYTDNSTSNANFTLQSWTNNTDVSYSVIRGNNLNLSTSTTGGMHVCEISADSTKLLKQIKLQKTGNSNSRAHIVAVSGIIPIGVPEAVTASAKDITTSSFKAEWDAAEDATGYRYDVSTEENFSTFLTGCNNQSTTETSFQVTGLTMGQTYYFRVRAYNDKGTSDSSQVQSVKIPYIHHAAVAPTCTQDGNVEYWEDAQGKFYLDEDCTKALDSVIDPAIGHAWGEASYVWRVDGKNWICTATRTCGNDSTHVESEESTAIADQTTDPTCETKGETTYTATFVNTAFTKQEKKETDVEALGHRFIHLFDWVWNGFDNAVAYIACDHNKDHIETADAAAQVTNTVPAECEKEGYIYHTATIDIADPDNGTTTQYTDTKVETLDQLGHAWGGVEYNWDYDGENWYCTATRVCERDSSHIETEKVKAIGQKETDPTCEENGSTTYTATFDNPDFEKQTHTESDIAAIGHKFIHFIKWVWDGF
ncbi:MAG: fibronectin type III domain-containing protein, partial [Clostridia bacterium]|nr:fibronectin type III domain-containing protein [Clostridia bacterium]